MKRDLFEIGASWDEGWSSDNKNKPTNPKQEPKKPSKHRLYFAKEKRNGKIVTILRLSFLEVPFN